jgi:hypothetical protein
VSAKPFHGSEGLAGVNQVAYGTHQQFTWENGDIIMQENNDQNSAHAPSPSDLETSVLLVWLNVLQWTAFAIFVLLIAAPSEYPMLMFL